MSDTFDVIVIGGGIAGSAAALRAAQNGLSVAWIRGDAETWKRSRGAWVVNVDNMIGVHDGIARKKIAKQLEKAGHLEASKLVLASTSDIGTREIIENVVDRLRAEYEVTFVEAAATNIERGEPFQVAAGETYRGHAVVLATGVMDEQPSIKKSAGDDISWIYPFANRESVLYCIRCEGHLTSDHCAAIIGSSAAAAEVSMMLHERYGSACAIVTNGEKPSWSARAEALLAAYGIPVHKERIVDLRGRKGELHSIELENGKSLPIRFALVSLGLHRVYNDLARQLGAELTDPEEPIELRHVRIDTNGETSVPGLFAVGDMARRPDEPVMKQIYTSQEYAVRAVDLIDRRRRRARRNALLPSAS